MYDIAVIGAGINGCAIAHELTKAGKRVLLLDMESIAGGGSGAAGAFISPKFSKSGELKELLRDAFVYSLDFYEKNFPRVLRKAPLIHIAKDEESCKTLISYKETAAINLTTPSKSTMNALTEEAKAKENVCVDAGIVNAQAACSALGKLAKFVKLKVDSLVYDDGSWIVNEFYVAKEVVLATGAYEQLVKEPYVQLRGVWGHRIDVETTTVNECSLHQFVSISPSSDGVVAIGATHNVRYHPQTSNEAYDFEEGRAELLEKASRTLKLENLKIVKDYAGLRSGSFDYMPMVGRLVMSKETLANEKLRFQVKKPNYDEYEYYPNLYVINASGGHGFVLAPYLAKILSELILSDKKISDRLQPARFFARWAKKR